MEIGARQSKAPTHDLGDDDGVFNVAHDIEQGLSQVPT
jgi:hypothetical protein